ncbi:Sugar lactone lactonase YvrE [Nocardia amikacinitolerans]|uniref:SMP-30/gluconolactonase/LRE family protein n=1 Tax=Nocardia amikacinitolerans TaxID=756689 RepID=UPI0020A605A9|nr:superoxide dismutase [Nocardia amikacinitolerans]MCP2300044.1 Sugar lactone lactonase YvrE [Nocardia amikacinitolerans]
MSHISRRSLIIGSLLAATGMVTGCEKQAGRDATPASPAATQRSDLPVDTATQRFELPADFVPEGIASGPGNTLYVSSFGGGIYRIDSSTGNGELITDGWGTESTGMKVDESGRLFVCHGLGGDARVLDTRTNAVLAHYVFGQPQTILVNDTVLLRDSAWFTDSRLPVLYRLPLSGDSLPPPEAVMTLPITGDLVYTEGQNANGLCSTPDGGALLVVQTSTEKLFRVDPATGLSVQVDLGGISLPWADGLYLEGSTLYVVLSQKSQVAVFRMTQDGRSGRLVNTISDASLDAPTTLAADRDRLYLANTQMNLTTFQQSAPGSRCWVSAIRKA